MPQKKKVKDSAGNRYATPALEKGLDVLELLARQPDGLTKSQLARELHRTVSEIFRMLLCLESRGYIAQVSDERYSLTLKLFQLVQEHPPTERLIADSLPVMKRLATETLQSCHLGVLEGEQVVILAQVNSPSRVGFYVKLGSTVDLMDSSSGYVILAHQEAPDLERKLAEWKRRTKQKLPGNFAAHLEEIRAAGFEQRASYLVKGVSNISFPILDPRGQALGALTIPYIEFSDSAVEEARVIERLQFAAREITLAIGGKLPPGRAA